MRGIANPTQEGNRSAKERGVQLLIQSQQAMLGECNKETAFKILDFFAENGGNFVDTANVYQEQESEQWLGEWMELRQNRDEMVVATKYTQFYKPDAKIRYNYQGNHRKSMYHSLENSLKNLRTSYVDIVSGVLEEVKGSGKTLALMEAVLRPLVGFFHKHRGDHAVPSSPCSIRKGLLPRGQ